MFPVHILRVLIAILQRKPLCCYAQVVFLLCVYVCMFVFLCICVNVCGRVYVRVGMCEYERCANYTNGYYKVNTTIAGWL